jgi:hypothetical protein
VVSRSRPAVGTDTIAFRDPLTDIIAVVFVMKGGVVYKNVARERIAVLKIDYAARLQTE